MSCFSTEPLYQAFWSEYQRATLLPILEKESECKNFVSELDSVLGRVHWDNLRGLVIELWVLRLASEFVLRSCLRPRSFERDCFAGQLVSRSSSLRSRRHSPRTSRKQVIARDLFSLLAKVPPRGRSQYLPSG